MIDVFSESMLTITQACRILPTGRNGARPQFTTLWRWIRDGLKAPDGHLVKLEAIRIGCKWMTSREALARFFQRLTPAEQVAPPSVRSPSARNRDAERAGQALAKKGI